MKITNFPKEFKNAFPVLNQITKAGFEAYFVGGCVRDTLLGIPLHDVDIASSAYPAEIKDIFKHTVDTGIEHGTVMVLDHGEGYEVTTFRTESAYQDFRRPDHVTFVRSLREDLKRRDLTINALAMKVNGEVVDLFNGLDDLKNHIIRAVGDPHERYHEDALRMMRSIRFMSQLDFSMETNTQQAIADNAHLLSKIAIERIHVEWIKLLLGKSPQNGIRKFVETGLYKYCPGFEKFKNELLNMSSIDNLHLNNEVECWVLTGKMFGFNPKQTAQLMRAWKSSNELINQVKVAQNALMDFDNVLDNRLLFETGLDAALIANQIAHLLHISEMSDQTIKKAYEALPIHNTEEIQLDGNDLIRDLKMTPGPKIGKILQDIKTKILDNKLSNDRQTLIDYVRENY